MIVKLTDEQLQAMKPLFNEVKANPYKGFIVGQVWKDRRVYEGGLCERILKKAKVTCIDKWYKSCWEEIKL